MQASRHANLQVVDMGLVIDSSRPYIGASPDGLITCECHPPRLLEIKCPLCADIQSVQEMRGYLDTTGRLKQTHAYFYQIQCQLNVCRQQQCDFMVWTENGFSVETIEVDRDFWFDCLDKIDGFFLKAVMPELIARWYTRNPLNYAKSVDLENVVCFCRRKKNFDENIVTCSSTNCKIVQYHFTCLRLKNKPKSTWLCHDCRKIVKLTAANNC